MYPHFQLFDIFSESISFLQVPNIATFHVLAHVLINSPQALVNNRIPRLTYGRIPLAHGEIAAFTAKIGTK
jgi:hypothetical protein